MKNRNDMHIYVDCIANNSKGTIIHTQYDIIDYVIAYRFQGGPEQPIRYLEMKVDKNNIDAKYPTLMTDIVEGQTRLIIDAVDNGTFIVSKIWLNDNEYELTASGIEVILNTATLSSAIGKDDPVHIAKKIFDDWVKDLNLWVRDETLPEPLPFTDEFVFYVSSSFENRLTTDTDGNYIETSPNQIGFKTDMPTLVAINMCAISDGAFVFVGSSDKTDEQGTVHRVNTMYYVSYNDIDPLAYNPQSPNLDGILNVYPSMNHPNTEYSEYDLMMFQKLIGTSSKRSEGQETIINNQTVAIDGGQKWVENQYSKNIYGDCAGALVSSDLITGNSDQAEQIAKNIIRRYKDPTRSITIALAESQSDATGTGWVELIPMFSYAKKIIDDVNGITLTNEHYCEPQIKDGKVNPDKEDNFVLRLSTYIRYYPEFNSEYTFGVAKETTLSQELANKLQSMSITLLSGISEKKATYDSAYSEAKPQGFPNAYYLSVNEADNGSLAQIFLSIEELNNGEWSQYCVASDGGRLYIFHRDSTDPTKTVDIGYIIHT